MTDIIHFCIKTKDGRYMPVIDYIRQLEESLERELRKND